LVGAELEFKLSAKCAFKPTSAAESLTDDSLGQRPGKNGALFPKPCEGRQKVNHEIHKTHENLLSEE
jgi:hypothetical protein